VENSKATGGDETGTRSRLEGPNPFVYAGKSHPVLTGADLIVTYVANGSDQTLANDMSIYYPRFVRLALTPTSAPVARGPA